MKTKLWMIRYAGPCENITVAVCATLEIATKLLTEANAETFAGKSKWEIVEISPDEFIEGLG